MKFRTLQYIFPVMLVVASCIPTVEPVPEPEPEEDFLTITAVVPSSTDVLAEMPDGNLNVYFADAPGSVTFKVKCSSKWAATASDASEWLTFSPSSGTEGPVTVTVSASANSEEGSRSATYEIACGTAKRTVSFVQKQKNALLPAVTSFNIEAAGGIITVDVNANVNYTVTVAPEASWMQVLDTKSMQASSFQLQVAANESVEAREGTVTVAAEGISETIKVSQSGVAPVLTVQPKEYSAPFEGASFQTVVESNVPVSVQVPEDASWITCVPSRSATQNVFEFVITDSDSFAPRSATLTFVNDTYGLREQVTVTQAACPPIQDDEVWYTTSTGKALQIGDPSSIFDVPVVANTYYGTHGILKFAGKPTVMKKYALFSVSGPFEITSFTVPPTVKTLEMASFYNARSIKEIVLPEGVESIGANAFSQCFALERLTLPSTITGIGYSAFFSTSIKEFLGPCKFIVSDGKAITRDVHYVDEKTGIDHSGRWIIALSSEVEDYVIPDGITGVDNNGMDAAANLRSLVIPASVKTIGVNAVKSSRLEYIGGPYATSDNRCYVSYGDLQLFAPYGLKSYATPSSVTSIGDEVFADNNTLEELVINDEVTFIGAYAFQNCTALKTLTLPSNLTEMSFDPFDGSTGIENIYVRSLVPPQLTSSVYTTEFPNLKVNVPEEAISSYRSSVSWAPYSKYLVPKHYEDISHPTYYISTDFSANGRVKQLLKASQGNGIDIVLMGDAFSDRQIADGTYAGWMNKAVEAFFSVEPYKTFKNLFNVYSVDVVSNFEGFSHGPGALKTNFGSDTYVDGDLDFIKSYAFRAVDESKVDNLTILVIPNKDVYSGTTQVKKPASTGGYAQGLSICWVPATANFSTFESTLNHEMGGHGFGKLQDEYSYSGSRPSEYDIQGFCGDMADYGWYANISFTNSPSEVGWSKFLADPRYASQGLGIYEGALFEFGAYRPSNISIMRYCTGGFNAPSREIIYKRIMSLAYGSSWTYDYETFVEYDKVNLAP